MKITVNVECTPEEARTFMGLPDMQPFHNAIMQEVQEQVTTNLRSMTPEGLMSQWIPSSMQNAEQLQKLFWNQVQNAFSGKDKPMVSFTSGKDDAAR